MIETSVIKAVSVSKNFRISFWQKRVAAVSDISLSVERGEIFGLLGPNGAGKTTFIKMLTGLIFPSAGSIQMFGLPASKMEAKRRLGFLPESPYFYDFLSGAELLDVMGRLCGLDGATRRRRSQELLERVGLAGAKNRALRKYSKGMLQRIGLAQALINDPELVILDEPMSGLDPIGRKEVRDIIFELKKSGKTILFSSHILSDVELLCDRVAIIVGGRMRAAGRLEKILSPKLLHTELVLQAQDGQLMSERLPPEADVMLRLQQVLQGGQRVVSLTPRRESLESLFVREVQLNAAPESTRRPSP